MNSSLYIKYNNNTLEVSVKFKKMKSSIKLLCSLLLFGVLSACGSNESNKSTNRAVSKIPGAISKLATGGGDLRAYVTIDNDDANRIEMVINPNAGGSASVEIPSLTRAIYEITITYEYTDNNRTIVLATASNTVDLTSGSGSLNFEADNYILDIYDEDQDGASNAGELFAGSSPFIPLKPIIGAVMSLSFEGIKTFRFTWNDVGDASYYQVSENIDGASGFTQVGENIPQGTEFFEHIVPIYARLNSQYRLETCNLVACTSVRSISVPVNDTRTGSIGYFKSDGLVNEGGNRVLVPNSKDSFGSFVKLSDDGKTLAIGVSSTIRYGSVYIFTHTNGEWNQQIKLQASNAENFDNFGVAGSLSADGNTLAVGAIGESSNARGVSLIGSINNSAANSGAVYIYVRNGNDWSQQAYIKPSNTEENDNFGWSVSLSSNGNSLAVGSPFEDSSATGILNANQLNNTALDSGAVYIFNRNSTSWSQNSYIKASNTDVGDMFGTDVSLNGDGTTLVVGSVYEDSAATGINGLAQTDNNVTDSGAVYVFSLNALNNWVQDAYIKADIVNISDRFGSAVSLSENGNTLVITATGEDGGDPNNPNNNTISAAGAAYIFTRSLNRNWSQQAYIKANNIESFSGFGDSASIDNSGNILVIGASSENSRVAGINGDESNQSHASGAAYIYRRFNNSWVQQAHIKSSSPDASDRFGQSVGLSGNGDTLSVGADNENSSATGIGGVQNNIGLDKIKGAVYLY